MGKFADFLKSCVGGQISSLYLNEIDLEFEYTDEFLAFFFKKKFSLEQP